MKGFESAQKKEYFIDLQNQNINSVNLSRQSDVSTSKRKPKLIQNNKVVQKLFNMKAKTINIETYTFAKPKRSLPLNENESMKEEDMFIYLLDHQKREY